MGERDLGLCADRNRKVFDEALGPYVAMKLDQVVRKDSREARAGWFDASGCVWCLFDGEDFTRSGDAGRRLRAEQGDACPFQVFWSMGDVVMPGTCDARWVAERIVEESVHQLSERGYRCTTEEREVEGEMHLGVRYRKRLLHRFWG